MYSLKFICSFMSARFNFFPMETLLNLMRELSRDSSASQISNVSTEPIKLNYIQLYFIIVISSK